MIQSSSGKKTAIKTGIDLPTTSLMAKSHVMSQLLSPYETLMANRGIQVPAGGKQRLEVDQATQERFATGLVEWNEDLNLPGSFNKLVKKEEIIQVNVAAKTLTNIYVAIKQEWDGLKRSMKTLMDDIEYILTRYFKETGQEKKKDSTPTLDDVINSFTNFPNQNDWIGRPLLKLVDLMYFVKERIPAVAQNTNSLSHIEIKQSVTDTLKKIKDLAEGTTTNNKTHHEVSAIVKGLGLSEKQRMYIPLVSTVPFVLDDIEEVRKQLELELELLMETTNVTGIVPLMVQTAPMNLSEIDAKVINIYRNHIKNLEGELSLRAVENQDLRRHLLFTQFDKIQSNDLFGLDNGTSVFDQNTGLDNMLRIFEQKISNYKLKDVSKINFTTSIFAAGIFDTNGGNLTIEDSDVNLYIPSGAIPKGTRKEIYIYLDTHAQLKLENKQETRVAPIIHCGPPGTSFDEPFVLSFPHSAENTEEWKFSGMIQDSRDPKNQWQNIEEGSKGISMVQGGYCIIMVNHFTNFTMIGSTGQQEGAKRIHMCTFGKSYDKRKSYTFNFRAWNPHDEQIVMSEQRHLRENSMDSIKTLSVQNTGRDLRVYLSNIKSGWESEYEEEMRISQDLLWYEDGGRPPSCRFRLKTRDSTEQDSVRCRVKSKQEGGSLEVSLDVDPANQQVDEDMEDRNSSNLIVAYKRQFGPLGDFDIPERVCHELCRELDAKEEGRRDWRGLAEQIGCEKMIDLYDQNSPFKSPTASLLNILKTKSKGDFGETLFEILQAVGNHQATRLIEQHLKGNSCDKITKTVK